MMKISIATAALAAAAMLAGTAVYAHDVDADRSQPKAFVKDSVITTKVKSKLAADHLGSLAHIRVDTDANGVVYLSGTAHSHDAVERAVEIARDTDGVRGVHNAIVVKQDE
ncbi:MAG TPA: BON domain-containing protein [Steroidobacteraceae bacterium]|nr:BON domain-containing protein [Steroidobacteraceae bacterium]